MGLSVFLPFVRGLKSTGGPMKIALATIAGFTISTLIVISVFQLFAFLIKDLAKMVSEAWYAPEHH